MATEPTQPTQSPQWSTIISVPTLMCSRHLHARGPGTCSGLWGGTEQPWLPGSVPMQLQLPAAGSPVPLGLCRRQARLQGASEPPLCRELPVHVRAPGTSWRHQDPFPPQKHGDPWGGHIQDFQDRVGLCGRDARVRPISSHASFLPTHVLLL